MFRRWEFGCAAGAPAGSLWWVFPGLKPGAMPFRPFRGEFGSCRPFRGRLDPLPLPGLYSSAPSGPFRPSAPSGAGRYDLLFSGRGIFGLALSVEILRYSVSSGGDGNRGILGGLASTLWFLFGEFSLVGFLFGYSADISPHMRVQEV